MELPYKIKCPNCGEEGTLIKEYKRNALVETLSWPKRWNTRVLNGSQINDTFAGNVR